MSRWNWNPFKQEPSPEAVKGLEDSRQQLAEVQSREPAVRRLTAYLDHRYDQNHFGEAIDITYKLRNHHA